MKRFFFKDGSNQDCTTVLNDYNNGSLAIVAAVAPCHLYVGSRSPINSIHIKMQTPATPAGNSLVAHYWTQSGWVTAVETTDETNGFSASGKVSWTPNRDNAWKISSTNYQSEVVTGLEAFNVYDLYWTKITLSSGTLDAVFAWAGDIFSNDNDLAAEFPDLVRSNVLTSFKTGKTSWEEQHIKATEVVINDLIDKGIILEGGQIINPEEYRGASVMKCAEIIFRSFGDGYLDRANEARAEYIRRLDKRKPNVDRNNNATDDVVERRVNTGFLSR